MSKRRRRISYGGPWARTPEAATIHVMNSPQIRRLVLVPTPTARGDELVRRYRLAQLRLAGREAAMAARPDPPPRSG
jgi:hypothetical protein